MKHLYKALVLATLLLTITTSCYRMPTDEDYSLIPMTNNPDYTKTKSACSPTPGVGY